MDSLRRMLRALLQPVGAFHLLAQDPPPLGRSVWTMSAVWMPLAWVHAFLTIRRAVELYTGFRTAGLPAWLWTLMPAGTEPEDLRRVLAELPPAPEFLHLWPWLFLLVPLGVLGAWLHHAVWDHTCLWILGGLKERRGFRTSLLAEAQALRIAALGTLAGLLGFLPWIGGLLALPLLLLDTYLWAFRGFSLAAFHGCETWKGVAATVLHAALLGGCACGLLGANWLLLRSVG